ncbi:4'-phosphopantetheinyl transferase superfamily protein [Klebsiella pneumoniae]|nr:4'-phosphopantetheinyl transferase superfamily protein [Klebsiella pneumoniae]
MRPARGGDKQLPAIGDQRQPLWPTPWFGSISHCGQRALAVVADRPVGVDIERRFTPSWRRNWRAALSVRQKNSAAAQRSALPAGADAGVFSQKSGFKAWSSHALALPGFHSARIVALTAQQVHLRFTASFSVQLADFTLQINHLIKDDFVITCTCPPREA